MGGRYIQILLLFCLSVAFLIHRIVWRSTILPVKAFFLCVLISFLFNNILIEKYTKTNKYLKKHSSFPLHELVQRDYHATASEFRCQPFRKKTQPYRAILDVSVNEHLKNANFRNNVPHKSHIQRVTFGYLHFHFPLRTLLERQEAKIY